MKIIFISDFFRTEVLGGAESNDSVLLSHLLKKNYNIKKINCVHLDNSYYNKNNFFIVSNLHLFRSIIKVSYKMKDI